MIDCATPRSTPDDPPRPDDPPWAPGYRFLTEGIPPVACRFRATPEDFQVEELPEEEPEGEGSHLWLTIEKVGIPTEEAVRRLARALGRSARDCGFAGRKDARAVARQRVSIEHADLERARGLALPGVRVLRADRARGKLRLGALLGNRFRLVLRDVAPGDREALAAVLAEVERRGLPNTFGSQRFGRFGLAHELGALLVAGDPLAYLAALVSERHARPSSARAELEQALLGGTSGVRRSCARLAPRLEPELAALARQLARRPRDPAAALRAIPLATLRFHLSALQSRAFNRVLAARLGHGAHATLEPGDRALEHATGRVREVADRATAEALGPALARLEVSPTGPLPGGDNLATIGRPAQWERAALAEEGFDLDACAALGPKLAPRGDRRALRVPLGELTLEEPADGTALLAFTLPAGSYATALMAEIQKAVPAPGGLGGPGGKDVPCAEPEAE